MFVANKFGFDRVPFERALEDHGNATDEDGVHGINGGLGIADGGAPITNAFEEISGMAVDVIDAGVGRTKRLAEEVGWVRDNVGAIHGNAAFRADKAGAAFVANRLAREAGGMHHHAVGVVVMDVAIFGPRGRATRIRGGAGDRQKPCRAASRRRSPGR